MKKLFLRICSSHQKITYLRYLRNSFSLKDMSYGYRIRKLKDFFPYMMSLIYLSKKKRKRKRLNN